MNKYAVIEVGMILHNPETLETKTTSIYSLVRYEDVIGEVVVNIKDILIDNSNGELTRAIKIFNHGYPLNSDRYNKAELPDDEAALLWFKLEYGG